MKATTRDGGEAMNPTDQDRYWFERLDGGYDKDYSEETQARARAWFRDRPVCPTFLMDACRSFGLKFLPKAMWENLLLAMEKWLPDEAVVAYFCGYLADPNWPGYCYAWETLLALGPQVLPLLDQAMEVHKEDEDQVENLRDLAEEIHRG